MSFNEDELQKIKSKTSGFLKGKARAAISDAIKDYEPKVQAAKSLPDNERAEALLALANQATDQRQIALQNGANSYGDPAWAAASTIESWLHELVGGEHHEIDSVEMLIQELRDRT
jgi:hypothetical protein